LWFKIYKYIIKIKIIFILFIFVHSYVKKCGGRLELCFGSFRKNMEKIVMLSVVLFDNCDKNEVYVLAAYK
jgi:hypothetical protein